MSNNNRKKHKSTIKFKQVPKARVEMEFDVENGLPRGYRKVDHVLGNKVYHPTKGWRPIIQYAPHLLLDKLFKSIGLTIYSN